MIDLIWSKVEAREIATPNIDASPRLVFTEDGRYLTSLPKDYYATSTYADKMISFIEADRGDGKPFFAYVGVRLS